MSLILVLDSVTNLCCCALYRQEKCLMRLQDDIGKGHGEHLINQIERLLHQARIDKSTISHIGVNIGPGTFTGIRIGVATARSLALALQIKAVGVNRFDAIHYSVRQTHPHQEKYGHAIILPAVQDKFAIQIFDETGQAITPPHQATRQEIIAQLPTKVILSGTASEEIAQFLKSEISTVDFDTHSLAPEAELDAIAAIVTKTPSSLPPPSPLYMRPPDAKPAQDAKITFTAKTETLLVP